MQNLTTSLFWAAACQMSPTLKVFVVDANKKQCVDLVKAGAKEVVFLGEDQKIKDVKVRGDYRERANSKDMIIDPLGSMPLEDVARLLKKKGFYLTQTSRDWSEYFAIELAVQPQAQALNLLVLGEGSEFVGDVPQAIDGEASTGDTLFYLVATHELPALPNLKAITTVNRQQVSMTVYQDALDEKEDLLDIIKQNAVTYEKTQGKLENSQREVKKLKKQAKTLESKVETLNNIDEQYQDLSTQHEQLIQEYQTQEAGVQKLGKKYDKLDDKYQANREKSKELQKENKALNKTLKKVQDELQKLKHELATQADHQAVSKKAQAQAQEAQACYQHIADAWRSWVQQGFNSELPLVPPAQMSLVSDWSHALCARQPLVSSTSADYQELLSLRNKSQEDEALKVLLQEQRDEARTQLVHVRAMVGSKDETLQQALLAEQALRVATEARLQEQDERNQAYESEITSLQTQVDDLQEAQSIAQIYQIDPNQDLQARLAIQIEQQQAFDRILQVHQQMQSQLTQALSQEVAHRAQAEYQQHILEEEIRNLKAHIQYPLPQSSTIASIPSAQDVVVPTPILSEQSKQRLSDLSKRLKQKAYQQQTQTLNIVNDVDESSTLNLRTLSDHDQKRIQSTKERLKQKAFQQAKQASSLEEETSESNNEQRAKNLLKERLKKLSRKK